MARTNRFQPTVKQQQDKKINPKFKIKSRVKISVKDYA